MTLHPSIGHGPRMPELLREETLADLFAATAAARPDAIALAEGDRALAYAELAALTDRMAAALQAEGAGPGRFVGLWMPRGIEVLVAQIAITKSGAAWVPFDAQAPRERVLECLEDLGAAGIVVPQAWTGGIGEAAAVFAYEDLASAPAATPAPGAGFADPAYVIYTSGSTGKPKGICITHRNICHFLRAAAATYGLTAEDAMLQSGSIAFDLSLEEIWLPLLVGARLEVCPAETLADPEKLVAMIAARGVTAIDVVPTLLGLIEGDLPGVKLIIVGGEACPEAIVARFGAGERRLVNSYGPTEATVVATATRLVPGAPVTIGTPLPNMTAYVVDANLNLVPRGAEGELLIGGPGVAEGYVGRPELTAEKFIANPFGAKSGDPVLYRTGDAVAMDPAGALHFRGRIDDQVKIRGFRIELGEIETRLARAPGIAQAAVVVNKARGFDQLVGYVTLEPGAAADVAAWKAQLAEQLPPYMVPSVIETVESLPRLAASGKVDRKALAARPLAATGEAGLTEPPLTETEAKLGAIALELFPGQPIGFSADFFLDLGGHSLLAAQFVSAARADPALARLSLNQIYTARTLRAIAAAIDADAAAAAEAGPVVPAQRASPLRRLLCGLAQLAVMPLLLTMQAAPWLAIFISYALIADDDAPLLTDLGFVMTAYAAINVMLVLFAIGAKWLLIGRTRPGRYPLWGSYYYRVWLVQRLVSLVHFKWLQNSPLMRLFLRALGARVGKDALISDFDAGAIDLLSFGDHVSIGSKTIFANVRIDGAHMVIGRVTIGDDAMIGSSSTIEGDVVIGARAELADLTALPAGARIGAGEIWDGTPAVRVGMANPAALPEPPAQTPLGRAARGFAYLAMLLVLPAVTIVPIVPAFHLMEWVDTFVNPVLGINYLWYMPVLAMVAAGAMIVFTLLLIVAARWIILPRVAPGRYAVTSGFYMRRWAMGLLTEVALDTLSSLFATLYMRAWYKLMGSKVGKGTEISTNFAGRYELIELGAGNFIADDVVFGDDWLRRGWLELERTTTGDRVFIGNEAVIPQGAHIASDALVGVRSKPPAGGNVAERETWFGSPPISLPTRQRFDHDERATYRPPLRMVMLRAVFEFFNITLPTALFITFVTVTMEILAPVFDSRNWGRALLICVLASVVMAIVQLLVGAGYKWLMMGRYRPVVKPMWSWWALRTEAVAVMYWGMAGKALLDILRGTPFLPVALRLFGVRTGKGIYMDSADITEFDCVTIGDDAVLNNHAVLQTHLYEDRLMKVGRIKVGEGVVIGAGTTVLYDTELGDDVRLGPLTLLMKGEYLPAGAHFGGAPARPI